MPTMVSLELRGTWLAPACRCTSRPRHRIVRVTSGSQKTTETNTDHPRVPPDWIRVVPIQPLLCCRTLALRRTPKDVPGTGVKHNHGVWTAIEILVHSSPWRQTVPAHINSVTRSWHDNLEGWSVPLATSTDAQAAAPFTRALGWISAGTQPRVERQMKHGRGKCGMHVIAACSRGPFSRRPSMSIEG